MGFVILRNSDFVIIVCMWMNKKWLYVVFEGKMLFWVYVGKVGDELIVDFLDNDIINIVLEDLKKVMNINGELEMICVICWYESMLQYYVGYKQCIKELCEVLSIVYLGVYVIGVFFEGVGIFDCID